MARWERHPLALPCVYPGMAGGILRERTVVTEPRSDLAELYVRYVPAANRLAFP